MSRRVDQGDAAAAAEQAGSSTPSRRGSGPRPLSLIVFVALAAAAVLGFVASRRLVDEQEQRLLDERAADIELFVQNYVAAVDAAMRVAGPVGAADTPAAQELFTAALGDLVQGTTSVAVLDGEQLRPVTAVGPVFAIGGPLGAVHAEVARQALGRESAALVSDIVASDDQSRIVLARRLPEDDAVVVADIPVAGRQPVPALGPARAVRVTVYASATPDPAEIILTTESVDPVAGDTVEREFTVGASRWTAVIAARSPLAGSFAHWFPWVLVVFGAGAAVLAAVAVEAMARRRAFAEHAVAARTLELDRTRAFLERIVTSGPAAIARVTPPDFTFSYTSPNLERLFASVDAPSPPGIRDGLVHPDDIAPLVELLERLVRGESEREVIEHRAVRAGGGFRWVSTVLVREHDTGDTGAILVYTIDVDRRRRAEAAQADAFAAAEAANRAKNEFLSRVSHELRTPLNAVLGFAQLLEAEPLTDEQHEFVGYVLRGGRHLLDLINEVLDISRIESGELRLASETIDVARLVHEQVELIGPFAHAHDVTVTARDAGPDVAADAHYARADRQRVTQILLNLLSNAVKYNRPGGTATVTVSGDRDAVRVDLVDTGRGIQPDRIDRLFQPFERLGAEHTGEEGTGIGLALSLRLAEAMGGTLTARSVPGEGSTFTLELPRAPTPQETSPQPELARPAPAPGTGGHVVLYVEDQESNRVLVERILRQRPTVTTLLAADGATALELARHYPPSLVLLDLHLPDMAGIDVLHALRADPATADVPIVVLSADAIPAQIERLRAAGVARYLPKPLDARELLDVIDESLVGRSDSRSGAS